MEQQHDQLVRVALEELAVPNLQVLADAEGIVALERRLGSDLRFAEALRCGIAAFLGDTQGSPGQGHYSAHHVVRADPESYGLRSGATDAEVTEALRAMLAGDPSARVVLLTPATTAQPEYRPVAEAIALP